MGYGSGSDPLTSFTNNKTGTTKSAVTMGKKNKKSRKEKRKSTDEVSKKEKAEDAPAEQLNDEVAEEPKQDVDIIEGEQDKQIDQASMKEEPKNLPPNKRIKSNSEEKPNFFSSELFSALPLSEKTQTALRNMKMERMTQIQAKAIPSLLTGKDLIGAAKTGSGKVRFSAIVCSVSAQPEWLC